MTRAWARLSSSEKVDRIDAALTKAQATLERLALAARRPALGGPAISPEAEERKSAWRTYVRRGDESGLVRLEQKALSVGSDADGGYVAPPEIDTTIDARLTRESVFRQIATVRATNAFTFKKPITVQGAAVGWANETAARAQTNSPTLDLLAFPAGELYAMPAATQTLLDDAAADIDEWLAAEIADAFAGQENAAFVAGDGINKPKGLLSHTLAPDAAQTWGQIGFLTTGVAGAFPATNPADKLIDLTYAPKAPFRANAKWLMNRKTVSQVRKFKDSTGNYIWQPSMIVGQPASLLGFPVVELEDMPDIAANSYSIAFGDFQKGYLIVDRVGVRVLRDPFSAKPYVLFYVTKRVGGGVQNFDALKLLKFSV
jgi:HK97 family phage major capsid protein